MVILVAEQDISTRRCLHLLLCHAHDVLLCEDASAVLKLLEDNAIDLVLHSLDLPGGNNLPDRGKTISPTTNFVAMIDETSPVRPANPDVFFLKPFDVTEVDEHIRRVEESRYSKFSGEIRSAEEGLNKHLIGTSPEAEEARRFIKAAALATSPVLLSGPPGTGKRHIARLIHDSGPRGIYPFITLDCANVDPEYVEAELFGFEKGAFRGAAHAKAGKLELARGGSLLLEEVAGLSVPAQARLLQFLRERVFFRLGGTRAIRSNARILSESNVSLKNLVFTGKFDAELFAQLNLLTFETPRLSKHAEDIPPLLKHFCDRVAHDRKQALHLTNETREILETYSYPGNIKEMQILVETLGEKHSDKPEITPELLPVEVRENQDPAASTSMGLEEMLQAYELELIMNALENTGNDERQAAALLKIKHSVLVEKLKKFGFHSNEGEKPKKVA